MRMKDAVNHLRNFPASTLDLTSLLNLRTTLAESLERHDVVREKLGQGAVPGELAYWDMIFRDDIRSAEAALNDIDAELNLRKVAA